MRYLTLFALALLHVNTLPAQGITLAEGATASSLDVRVLDESSPQATGTLLLQDVALQQLELNGRVVGDELATDRSRRLDRNGVVRIELPGGGRILHYERAGGLLWGYLHVPHDGLARVLTEAASPAQPASPFADRIGVARDGRHAAVADLASGLHVMRLDGQTYASTSTPGRLVPTPAPVMPESVMVGPNFLFYTTVDGRVWRLGLQDGAQPEDCTPPNQPLNYRLKDEFAMAGNGRSVAFLCGERNSYDIFHLGETGAAAKLSSTPSKYGECDYLPVSSGHPGLKLNDDGSRLFFVDESFHDELFLADTTGVLSTLHITQDAIFEPTIGIHIMPSFMDATLLVSIGREDLMDWYRVKLDQLGGEVVNLTGTGALTQPFPQGTMIPTQAGTFGSKVLATDATGANETLRLIDPTAGTSAVLSAAVIGDLLTGSAFHATPDIYVPGAGGSLYDGATGALRAVMPDGVALTPPVHGPGYAATWVQLPGDLGLVAIYLNNGVAFGGGLQVGTRQLIMTSRGNLLIDGDPAVLYTPTGATALPQSPPVRIVLSGAGA